MTEGKLRKVQTSSGPLRLRNVPKKVIGCQDKYVPPGYDCPGEILFGNPFLLAAGLSVKNFFADNIDHIASLDFGTILDSENLSSAGPLCKKLSQLKVPYQYSAVHSLLTDGDDIDCKDVDVGDQDDDELAKEIESMIGRCSDFATANELNALRELVHQYKDIFRVRLGNDPPVDVPPMKIEFEKEERPIKVKQRTYSPEQLEFLKKKVDELIKAGFIYRSNNSKWACAPPVFPKPGNEDF